MYDINSLFKDKKQHYHYLEKLFRKVSKTFSQLAEMVTDLEDVFAVLENECILKRTECVYKRKRNIKFDRKKALPFSMFIKDAIDMCQKEHPEYDIVDCINALKESWDDPLYRSIREMYEYIVDERLRNARR